MSIIGLGFIGAGALIFIYCTLWLITPFIDPKHPVNAYFLDISVLAYGPLVLLAIGLVGLAAFLLKISAARKKKN